jgi:hypothetical protein
MENFYIVLTGNEFGSELLDDKKIYNDLGEAYVEFYKKVEDEYDVVILYEFDVTKMQFGRADIHNTL